MSAVVAGYRRLWRRSVEHGVRPYTIASAWRRVALMYLVSRRMTHSLVALAAIVVLAWWLGKVWDPAFVEDPMMIPRIQTLVLHLAAALLASVIGMAVWTPFGETEQVSPVVLPVMRAVHLALLVVAGLGGIVLVIRTWPDVMPGIDLGWLVARNTLFLTGCVLLIGRLHDVRLAWLVPVLFAGVTAVAILQRAPDMASPVELWGLARWNVLAQDQSNGFANAVCIGVAVGAISIYARDGVRDMDEAV